MDEIFLRYMIEQISTIAAIAGITFALWSWWEQYRERRVRQKNAAQLAKSADLILKRPSISPQPDRNAELIAAFSSILKNENRKSFWWGLFQNLAFFVLGLVAQPFANRLFP